MNNLIDISRPVDVKVRLPGSVFHELQALAAREKKTVTETLRDAVNIAVWVKSVYEGGNKLIVRNSDGSHTEILWER